MSNKNEIHLTPALLADMLQKEETASLHDNLVISRLTESSDMELLQYPLIIDSYLAAYCVDGQVTCSVNLTEYTLTKGCLLVITPGNVVRVTTPAQNLGNVKATLICTTPTFVSGIGMDINKILTEALTVLRNPCMQLTQEEGLLMKGYADLIYKTIARGGKYAEESLASLALSIFYHFASLIDKNHQMDAPSTQRSSRHKIMFENFMKLVGENHRKERMVGFYADKLCVTPKYLSKIIKDVSGQSAPEWINSFVILTSKHLLKHSELPIKEIAAEMNFPSQSFFFRFFKEHTGMTPSQYRQI